MTKGLKKVDVIEVEQDYYAHVIMLIMQTLPKV